MGTINIWNIATLDCEFTLKGHNDTISSLCMDEVNNILISSSFDGTTMLWCVFTGQVHT